MKSLIDNLFTHHKFEQKELDFGSLYLSNEGKKYYWLVIQQNDISDVLEKQDEWFEKSKEIINSKEFDKNTSLLILTNKDEYDSKKQEVLQIEEDPFQFKKYVLSYTNESLRVLIEQSNNGKSNEILDLMVNENTFNDYKINYSVYNWRHLLYNIAHKLPFLDINVSFNENLDDLFSDAENALAAKGLLGYSKYIAQLSNDNRLNDLQNMNVDSLIELLDNTQEDGN